MTITDTKCKIICWAFYYRNVPLGQAPCTAGGRGGAEQGGREEVTPDGNSNPQGDDENREG